MRLTPQRAFRKILVSRTDAIGDVVLTLPLIGRLREQHPAAEVYFLGSSYTRDLVQACRNVSGFLDWTSLGAQDSESRVAQLRRHGFDAVLHVLPRRPIAEACKAAGIPVRIGTARRLFHWWTCNVRPSLRRSASNKHEAELNIELAVRAGLLDPGGAADDDAGPFGLWRHYQLSLPGFDLASLAPQSAAAWKKVVVHVGSRFSSRSWPIEHFVTLASAIADRGGVVFVTGTQSEGDQFRQRFLSLGNPRIVDLTGRTSLADLLGIIARCDGLVACSTGPLHLAAAAGIRAVGIYPPIRPIFPQRWAPIGARAVCLSRTAMADCRRCAGDSTDCLCMREIEPDAVLRQLLDDSAAPPPGIGKYPPNR